MTSYIQNATGGVHSVNDSDVAAILVAHPSWTQLNAAAAKAANPQLFGQADPKVLAQYKPFSFDSYGRLVTYSATDPASPLYPQWSGWAG